LAAIGARMCMRTENRDMGGATLFRKSRGPVKRGEVWWAQVDERCPVVLLSSPGADVIRAILVVAPAERALEQFIEIPIGAMEGLPFDGVVRIAFPEPGFLPCNWLVTLSAHGLLQRIGTLSEEKRRSLDDALRRAELE
jgi:mRNA interferase MazF